MATKDDSFQAHLLSIFRIEADEHVKAMSSLLPQLESGSADNTSTALEMLFREAHSLKGAARAVNHGDMEMLCQMLESVLAALKRNDIAPSAVLIDALSRAVDTLQGLLEMDGETPAANDLAPMIRALSALLDHAGTGNEGADDGSMPGGAARGESDGDRGAGHGQHAVAPPPAHEGRGESRPAAPAIPSASQTVRISTAKLSGLMTQVEELLAYKFSTAHLAGEMRALRMEMAAWKKAWDKTARDARILRASAGRHANATSSAPAAPIGSRSRTLERFLEDIDKEEIFRSRLVDRFVRIERSAEQDRRALSSMVDGLLEDMKQALMLPFSSLLELFPRMVRDLARDNDKMVDLVVTGDALEIDRRVLEQMKDPLMHLVRNAVDHGIEKPVVRAGKGKPKRGRIGIDIAPRDGNKVELVISDDGAGLDVDKVMRKALQLGLISEEAANALSAAERASLVFESGLSTSPLLTDISGRGLGLAIVREKVETLGGSVEAGQSAWGGACFRIVLPSTLATFRGLLVKVGQAQFVLPSSGVDRVKRIARDAIKTVENRESIELDGELIGLVGLDGVLGLGRFDPAEKAIGQQPVIVLSSGGKRIAFAVDEVLGDQEVLVKGLGPQLVRVPNIAGATVLGPGRVVPILSVPDLLKSALRAGAAARVAGTEEGKKKQAVRKSVLVAEDSITSRSLLKNVLESAGYDVSAVVDGVDALTALRERKFDVVVSDVEMPRMDGFILTEKIRADKRFAEVPVVLVTALESREHKERGVEAGANAYIVKSSFDQSNLLEVIERLI